MKRIFRPSLIVGALSLAAVIGCYWYMATRPGINPPLVPSPPTIVASFGEELRLRPIPALAYIPLVIVWV